MIATKFYLRVHQVKQDCLFDLSWGQEQRLPAQLAFPETLADAYQMWRTAYLHHYETLPVNSEPEPSTHLRGQLVSKGSAKPVVNSHSALVKAQEGLLLAFHHWLRQPELHEICSTIARASRASADLPSVRLFLTCDPLDLTRLPWETWEIGAEDVLTRPIHILRMPASIRATANRSVLRHRPRILVILGDDRQLNLKVDQDIMASLRTVAEMQFIRRNSDESIPDLKQRIVQAITDETGWDMLFFAGHSSETELTGGELEIAARASIQISEITPQLKIAQQRGLRVAVFNSCEGLSFANSLVDLGLDQVVVMRERVHNSVAQEFLLHFCQRLVQHQTVYEATIAACQFLKTEKSLTYPSGYLLPSLFCRPEAEPFRIPPKSWITWLQRFKPKRYEAVAVAGLMVLSLLPPVQDFLLDRRVLLQTHYRQMLPSARPVRSSASPPTLLVRIDDDSINRDRVERIQYIDRKYLAKLISRLSELNASVIGLDYVLDRPQNDGDPILADAIQDAKNTRFVFASAYGNQAWLEPRPEFTSSNWSVVGDIEGTPYYTTLLNQTGNNRIPFPYWLVWLHQSLTNPSNVSLTEIEQVRDGRLDPVTGKLATPQMEVSWLTRLSYYGTQMWFHPILDYSIPPQQVYTDIPAWKVLQQPDAPELANVAQQIVVIAPGGYSEAGVQKPGQDTFRAPLAMKYWYVQQNPADVDRQITGGENHVYVIHHLLNQHFVVPVPDAWMVLLAALLGKGTVLLLQVYQPKNRVKSGQAVQIWVPFLGLAGGTLLYSLLSFQLYVSAAALLVPVVLPVATYWLHVAPALIRPLTRRKF